MSEQLQQAVGRLSSLPPTEQDAFAAFILAELDSEARWESLFARSGGVLADLGRLALQEDEAGLTLPLDLSSDFEDD